MKKAIQIDGKDNVATATSDLEMGETVDVLSPEGGIIGKPKATSAIPFGHKIAMSDLNVGDKVIKYGEIIGVASKPIKVGEWVHTHNVESEAVPTSAYREVDS